MSAIDFRLPNGLRVILEENHAARVVAFQAWVKVGSADEPAELAGMAHLFEHMLFKGTERRGVGQLAREVESAGGEINAWTSHDQTVYHLVLASPFFDLGLDVLGDALFHASFDPAELERERKVVLEEIRQGRDSPGRVATQALFQAAYRRHPYRRPVIGSEKTVRALDRARLVEFFRRHYVAENVTLVVVGDFDAAQARKKIAAAFAAAPRGGEAPPRRPAEPPQRGPRVAVQVGDVRESHVHLAFHVPPVNHEDIAALDVAAVLMAQGDGARLLGTVKRQREAVTDLHAYAYTPRDPGLLVLGATAPEGAAGQAVDALLEELLRLTVEEVRAEELERARALVESDAIYQSETVQGQARKHGFFATVAGALSYEAEHAGRVRALTPAALRETLARYLRPENLTVSLLLGKSAAGQEARIEKDLLLRIERAAEAAKARAAPVLPAREDGATRVQLPSGTNLLVVRDGSVGLVAMRAVWLGGVRWEDERTNGINHLLAQLVTRGTRTRSGDEIAHEVETLAGSIAGVAGRNSFGLRLEILSQNWERGLEILADCILHPAFDEAELDKERRLVLEELRARADSISIETFRLFQKTLFPRHPYRLDPLGSPAALAGLTRRRIAEYYRRHMNPALMTLAVVGDVDPEKVAAKAAQLFAKSRAAPSLPEPPPRDPPPSGGPVEVFQFLDKQQAHVLYGFPGLSMRDPDRYAVDVLTTVLSGQGGRLFVELRDKRGLAYRVNAFSVEGIDPGYIAVYIATSPANLEVAVAGIRDELARLAAAPISAEELARAKRYLVGTHEISLQRRSALAAQIAFHVAYGMPWDEHRRYAEHIGRVTAKDVLEAARRYLDPSRAVIATIKPEERTPRLERARPAAAPAAPGRSGRR